MWVAVNFEFQVNSFETKELACMFFLKCEIALNKKAPVALVIKEGQFSIVSKCEEWSQSHYSDNVAGEDSWLDYTRSNEMINGKSEDNEKMTKSKMKIWRKQPEGDLSKDKSTS